MPSNYTEHYHLNQWDAGDQVLRTDFNADNAKIDGAVKAVDQRVDSLSQTVSSQGNTLNSHGGSISRLGNCQIYSTTYTGTGSDTRDLSFPGYPVWVHIHEARSTSYIDFARGALYSSGSYGAKDFSVSWASRSFSNSSPFNRDGTEYLVIALLDMSK